MKKFMMFVAILMSLSGQAQAQMGPAGPPGGGGGPASNGTLRFWSGQTEVSSLPVGRGVTMVYTPSPGFYSWIDFVRVYKSTYPLIPQNAANVDFVLNGGTNGTYQPADPMLIAVQADAYLWNGTIVDSAPMTKIFKWNPINEISLGQVITSYPAQSGNNISLRFYMLDTETTKFPGPGARYRVNRTYTWKNAQGNAISSAQTQNDTEDRFGHIADFVFAVPTAYNNYKDSVGPNTLKLEISYDLLYASTPGDQVTVQKTINHTVTFKFGGVINHYSFEISDDAPLIQPYIDNN